MNRKVFFGFIILVLITGFFSCQDDNSLERLRQYELEKLEEFIQKNYSDVEPKSSGLYYIEVAKGTGDTIKVGDRVQIFYAKRLIDSTLIDQTNGYLLGQRYEPLEYVVGAGSVIAGLEEASTYMQKGTKANLVIPSELAYGQNGSSGVSGFSTLLMEVEVYKIYPAAQ
jgi:FKBP-type peptidyl-prolyl cis-trans isomerase